MKTSKKAAGFYVTLFSCVLAIASAICYGVLFKGIEYKEPVFDVRICVIMAAVGIVSAVLVLLNERTAGFAPALLCLGSGHFLYAVHQDRHLARLRHHLRNRALPRIYTAGCLCRAAGGHPGGLRSGAVHEEVPVRLMERTRREENSQ